MHVDTALAVVRFLSLAFRERPGTSEVALAREIMELDRGDEDIDGITEAAWERGYRTGYDDGRADATDAYEAEDVSLVEENPNRHTSSPSYRSLEEVDEDTGWVVARRE